MKMPPTFPEALSFREGDQQRRSTSSRTPLLITDVTPEAMTYCINPPNSHNPRSIGTFIDTIV